MIAIKGSGKSMTTRKKRERIPARGTSVQCIAKTDNEITFRDLVVENVYYHSSLQNEELRNHVKDFSAGYACVNIEYDQASTSNILTYENIDGVVTAIVKVYCRITYVGCFDCSRRREEVDSIMNAPKVMEELVN